MKTMIRSRMSDTWFREEDLAANIPGRPDPQFEIAVCLKYLREVWSQAARGPGIDEKARNAILHARVQGAFANPMIVQLQSAGHHDLSVAGIRAPEGTGRDRRAAARNSR